MPFAVFYPFTPNSVNLTLFEGDRFTEQVKQKVGFCYLIEFKPCAIVYMTTEHCRVHSVFSDWACSKRVSVIDVDISGPNACLFLWVCLCYPIHILHGDCHSWIVWIHAGNFKVTGKPESETARWKIKATFSYFLRKSTESSLFFLSSWMGLKPVEPIVCVPLSFPFLFFSLDTYLERDWRFSNCLTVQKKRTSATLGFSIRLRSAYGS